MIFIILTSWNLDFKCPVSGQQGFPWCVKNSEGCLEGPGSLCWRFSVSKNLPLPKRFGCSFGVVSNCGKICTWWFKVTCLGWLSDPFKRLSDLQLGDEKVTLNHLVSFFSWIFRPGWFVFLLQMFSKVCCFYRFLHRFHVTGRFGSECFRPQAFLSHRSRKR